MRCNNCGGESTDETGICRRCGLRLSDTAALAPGAAQPENRPLQPEAKRPAAARPAHKAPPYPYLTSTPRLLLFYFATMGLYQLVWFYRHWKSLKALSGENIFPAARSFFAVIYIDPLLKRFSGLAAGYDKDRTLNNRSLTALYLFSVFAWNLPSPFNLLNFLGVVPLLIAQKTINFFWLKKTGGTAQMLPLRAGAWTAVLLGGAVWILALIGEMGEIRLNRLPWRTIDDPKGSYTLRLPPIPEVLTDADGLTARVRASDCSFFFREERTGLNFSDSGEEELKTLIRETLRADLPEILFTGAVKTGATYTIDSTAKDAAGDPYHMRFVFKDNRVFRLATTCSSLSGEDAIRRYHAELTGSFVLR